MLETTKELEELSQEVRTTASQERSQANAQTISDLVASGLSASALREGQGRDLVEINCEAGAAQLPIRATFVLENSGVIRLACLEEDWSTRVKPDIFVDTLRGLGK